MKRFAPKALFSIALAVLCVFGFMQLTAPVALAFTCPSGYGQCHYKTTRIYIDDGVACCVYQCPWGEEIGPCWFL